MQSRVFMEKRAFVSACYYNEILPSVYTRSSLARSGLIALLTVQVHKIFWIHRPCCVNFCVSHSPHQVNLPCVLFDSRIPQKLLWETSYNYIFLLLLSDVVDSNLYECHSY